MTLRLLLAVLMFAIVFCRTASAIPPGSAVAEEAVRLCDAADWVPPTERESVLMHGMALGEAALRANPRDAAAHFAVACNLGKQMDDDGTSVRNLPRVARIRTAIDAAMRYAPDDSDVLAARGALLITLPRLLGGDPTTGQMLLQRALAVDPLNRVAIRFLGKTAECALETVTCF